MSELLNKGIFMGPLCEKNSLDVAKEKQKALVTPLQLQNVFLQAVAPTKEHFQQGKYVSGKEGGVRGVRIPQYRTW